MNPAKMTAIMRAYRLKRIKAEVMLRQTSDALEAALDLILRMQTQGAVLRDPDKHLPRWIGERLRAAKGSPDGK